MKAPLIEIYIIEIENLNKQKYNLSLILVGGTLCELYAREIAQEMKGGYEKLLNTLLNSGKISTKEYKLLERVRDIRNNYVHISSEKVLNSGIVSIDHDENISFLNEVFKNNPTEEDLVILFQIQLEHDSELVFKSCKELFNF
jgi:uncharacterized protein YutE (UPF0331/DUF86 family)